MDGKILMDDDAMEDVEGKVKRFSACSHANFFPTQMQLDLEMPGVQVTAGLGFFLHSCHLSNCEDSVKIVTPCYTRPSLSCRSLVG